MAKLKKTNKHKPIKSLGPDFDNMLCADGFDDAVIGFTAHQPSRTNLIVYDYDKCILILMREGDMDYIEAVEYMEYNVIGAWLGEGTPLFMHNRKHPNK
jgi:hypothetical protein